MVDMLVVNSSIKSFVDSKINNVLYSPLPFKYYENRGSKDKGTARNGFNQGRLDEIRNRFVHLDDMIVGE